MLFDLTKLPDTNAAWLRAVLARHTFDFDRCRPQLERESQWWGGPKRSKIPVTIADLSPQGWGAATWPDGRIKIDDDAKDDEIQFSGYFAHELGHVVDYFFLTVKRKTRLVQIYRQVYAGVEWEDISHPFCAGFTAAFSDIEATDPTYPPVDPIPAGIRRALV